MHETHYVSTTKMATCILWGLTAAMISGTWILAIIGGDRADRLAILLAFTAGILAPAASVAHIKCYMMKTTALIRLSSGLPVLDNHPEGRSLHSVP